MRTLWTIGLALLLGAPVVSAAPPDPLRLIPDHADLCLKIEQPRALIEGSLNLPAYQAIQKFPAVRELLTGTAVRRFQQLLAYYEDDLGAKWPELLDQLAGGGLAIGVKTGPDAPVVAVLQPRDPEQLKKFLALLIKVTEQELARQDSKDKVQRGTHNGIEGYQIGGQAFLAIVDGALVFANQSKALAAAIDCVKGKSLAQNPLIVAARQQIGADALAWGWFNLDTARAAPGAKDLFKSPRDDNIQTLFFGGILDVVGRAPHVVFGLHRNATDYRLSLIIPKGRNGAAPGLALHMPPAEAGPMPAPLAPRGVVYSESFYLDLATYWHQRDKLLNEKSSKDFERFDKEAGRFLPGSSVGKLLSQTGQFHRVVVANTRQLGYTVQPAQRQPAFAFITPLRDPQLAKSLEGLFRAAALFGGAQLQVKLVEEEYNNVKLVGYRFPEDGKLNNDPNNTRFNFSPCFATVGGQFLMCSRQELARELIELLQAEQRTPPEKRPTVALHGTFHPAGLADLLASSSDQLLAQTVLDQAVPIADAKAQVEQFLEWLRNAGLVQIVNDYRDEEFRFSINWNYKQN